MKQLDPHHVLVEAGDTIYKIATATGVAATKIVAANRMLPDPNVIKVGDVLHIPPKVIVTEPVPTPVAEVKVIGDFVNQTASLFVSADLVGRGRDLTRYVVRGSTMADEVAALPPPDNNPTNITNNYVGLRQGVIPVSGGFRTGTGGIVPAMLERARMADLTLDMGEVLHNVNGAQIAYVKHWAGERLRFVGARGTGSTPPIETACFALWHVGETARGVGGGSVLINDLIVDGRLIDGSAVVGSSTLMFNDAYEVQATKLVSNYARFGFAIALWQCGGTHFYDQPDFRYCRKAINFEQARDGAKFTFYRPDCRAAYGGGHGRPHAVINGNKGSAELWIEDPVWDRIVNGVASAFTVGVNYPGGGGTGFYPTSYKGDPNGITNTQDPADVHVKVDGQWYQGPCNTPLVKIGNYWS